MPKSYCRGMLQRDSKSQIKRHSAGSAGCLAGPFGLDLSVNSNPLQILS